MPISDDVRVAALSYIDHHLIDEVGMRKKFSFIENDKLLDLIILELKSARYVYRLMEMLDLKDSFSHPFCKFQIVQYAGVFEAAIDHIIFERSYVDDKLAKKVMKVRGELEKQEILHKTQALSKKTKVEFDGQEAFLATIKVKKKK